MYSENEIEHIFSAFKNLTLPKPEWTHKAQIVVAACFLLDHSLKEAVPLIRVGIKEYNVASGGVNNDVDGYHETITMFWIIKINEFMQISDSAITRTQLINDLLNHDFIQRDFPFDYYSDGLICSALARLNWVIPNLKQLDIPIEMGLKAVDY